MSGDIINFFNFNREVDDLPYLDQAKDLSIDFLKKLAPRVLGSVTQPYVNQIKYYPAPNGINPYVSVQFGQISNGITVDFNSIWMTVDLRTGKVSSLLELNGSI